MALNKEIWQKYIMEQLYKDNEFLNYVATVSDDNIINGKLVHIPNAGAKPGTQRNRSNVPASILKRTDIDVLYALDEFTTDPTYIENVEKVELSYDKINSVIGSHINVLKEIMADWFIYYWLTRNTVAAMTPVAWTNPATFGPTSNCVATSTTASGNNGPNAQALKKLASADIAKARLIMNRNNVPKTDRFLILPSVMYDELMAELSTTSNANIELLKSVDLPAGVMFKLYGFNIMERSSVALFNKATATAPLIVAPGTTETNDHGYGAIAWQKDMVEKAIGEVKMFENLNDPTLYGDVYSALVRGGGRARYQGATGVVPIIQAA